MYVSTVAPLISQFRIFLTTETFRRSVQMKWHRNEMNDYMVMIETPSGGSDLHSDSMLTRLRTVDP